MTLVDSLDSVLMLYAYAQPDLRSGPKRRFLLFTRDEQTPTGITLDGPETSDADLVVSINNETPISSSGEPDIEVYKPHDTDASSLKAGGVASEVDTERARIIAAKISTISSLSISLTLLSIAVALSISLIQIMGLIGENCARCVRAAEDPNGGGLEGSWWRAWARVSACWYALTAGERRQWICGRCDCRVFRVYSCDLSSRALGNEEEKSTGR